MRLLYLTAGAADMICGSCLRDNAIARELKARGHDVVLAPVYTPTHTDDENVSSGHVLFGGVSVYLQQHVPFFRHTPAWLDSVWDSTPVLRLASKRQIKVDARVLGEMTVSMLRGEEGFQRKEVAKMLRWLRHEPRFDAINLPFTLLIGLARPLRRALGTPMACMLQGEDLFLGQLQEPWKSQSLDLIRRAVSEIDLFLAVSDSYARFMTGHLGLPADRVRVVPLGITMTGHSPAPVRREPPYTIGYFARVAPEKGLHLLAEAYRRLRGRPDVPPTRLLAGGYMLGEHRAYLSGIERGLQDAGLASEFTYAGAPDRAGKLALLRQTDVFSAPATYDEPKGLSVLEALASGVPVVQPRRGTFVEIVERTGGGLLVTPDDPDALADGLLSLLLDRDRAAQLGAAGAANVRRQYDAAQMAIAAERAYQELVRA